MNGFYFLSLQVFEEGLLFNEMSFTHEEVVLGTQLKINVFWTIHCFIIVLVMYKGVLLILLIIYTTAWRTIFLLFGLSL